MSPLKSGIWNLKSRKFLSRAILFGVVSIGVAIISPEVLARVGGGQSYGGGGGSGGGGGGGSGALVYALIRFLIWLTIEHPAIGIPVDIIVIGLVVYWFTRKTKEEIKVSPVVVRPDAVSTVMQQQQQVQQAFNQLRRFDPNFSEIIFVDFCYALYGRAHQARGLGAKGLDELSPYLSQNARAALLQQNPRLQAVE